MSTLAVIKKPDIVAVLAARKGTENILLPHAAGYRERANPRVNARHQPNRSIAIGSSPSCSSWQALIENAPAELSATTRRTVWIGLMIEVGP